MIVQRVFGKTKDAELVSNFSDWLLENLDSANVLGDEEAIQGTMTLDFQAPTMSFVVEVQTYSTEFAQKVINQMLEIGFDTAIGVNKEGEIN